LGRIILDGSVGIKTTSPSAVLDIAHGDVTSNLVTPSIVIRGFTQTISTALSNARFNQIFAVTITASTAQTVTDAATLYIERPPIAGGSVTITNAASLLFGNAANQLILVQRSDSGTAGRNLTIQAGGATGTNLAGGELRLSSGIATGSGSSFLSFYTATAGSSGSADNLPSEKMRITGDGKVGIRTTSPTALLHLNGATGYNQLRLETSYTPTGSSDANGNVGDIAWDNSYIYVKTGVGWKRAALSTF
jgi:hypothetical protein